jgi:3-oxoadipate enol-lactonase
MPLAEVNNVTINYRIDDFTDPWRDAASVKTILMHHAYLRGLESLTGWVPILARAYRVVRFDSRGFGGSSAPPAPFDMTLNQLAADALGLMDYLNIEQVHFVGVSSGGIAGQLLAVSNPTRLLSLTLCDSPHRLNDAIRQKMSAGEVSPSVAIEKLGFAAWRERTINLTLDPTLIDPRMTAWQKEQQAKVPLHINISQQRSLETADTASILENIRCPTLLIGGDRSAFVPLDMLIFMAGQVPQAQVRIFPGVDSTLSVMRPEDCARAVLDFLVALDSRSS